MMSSAGRSSARSWLSHATPDGIRKPAADSNLACYALAFLVSAVGYWFTLAPTVTSEDSGELIAAAWHFGIPHPPGYPLWTMLCGAFIRILTVGEIAWRANLFSALCSAASTIPLFAILIAAGLRRSTALAATWLWAFSQTLWTQSVIAEVYALHALLTALLLWAVLRWRNSERARWAVLATVLVGLGLGNHHTILFPAAGLVLWLLLSPRLLLKHWLAVVASPFLLITVTSMLYLYVPLRAQTDPPMNWGNPSTTQAFTKHLLRSQYGTTAPLMASAGRSLGRFAGQMRYLGEVVVDDLTWPIVVPAIIGMGVLTHRDRSLALLVILQLLICGVGFVLISNIDLDRTFRFAMRVFFIPLSLVLVIPAAFGLDQAAALLNRVLGTRWRSASAVVPICAAVLPAIGNYQRCDYSHYWYAYDHARNLLACMLPNAMVFPSGDHNTFPLIYMVLVEGRRPDVIIADKYGYIDPAVIRQLGGRPEDVPGESERTRWLILQAHRPVYYTTKAAPPVANASFVPVGLVYHLLPDGVDVDRNGPWQKIHYRNLPTRPGAWDLGAAHILADYDFFLGLRFLQDGALNLAQEHFARCAKHAHGIKEAFNNIGSALAEQGMSDAAIPYFEQSRAMDRHYLTPRRNLLRIYRQRGNEAAVEQLEREIADSTSSQPRP